MLSPLPAKTANEVGSGVVKYTTVSDRNLSPPPTTTNGVQVWHPLAIATHHWTIVPCQPPPSAKAAAAAALPTAATRCHLSSCCLNHHSLPVQRCCCSAIVTAIYSLLCPHSALCLPLPAGTTTTIRVAHCRRSRCCLKVAAVVVAAISSIHSACSLCSADASAAAACCHHIASICW
jgi:hypothetical protein